MLGDTSIDFKLYPYKTASIAQYKIGIPFQYEPSKGEPPQFNTAQFNPALNRFISVLND
ncbi:hypothetical protein [Vibrio mexicanus]|uniref:hypothetical protein n=1 Tax=Vibrio mexicanus TaxID=1004326 RepID=UPI000B0FAAB6|nr:hypothetical protein [Vibrio mexicanus]